MSRKPRLRWSIATLVGIGILINFLDRTVLSVAAPRLADDFGLSLGELGVVLSAFSWSYCAMQLPSGVLLDLVGVKRPMRSCTILWALASALAGLATGPAALVGSRVLLGVGEGPGMVAAAKAVSLWFPLRERGLATALFDAATKLSNALALPTLALVTSLFGWRFAFFTTAGLSLLYAVCWWVYYREPDEHERLSSTELRYIRDGGARKAELTSTRLASRVGRVLRSRKVWALTLGFACYGYAINMLLTWAPIFLVVQFHLTVVEAGLYTAVPWVVATATDLLIGGWLADRLVRSGRDPSATYKALIALGFILGLAVCLAPLTTDANVALLWLTIAIGGLSIAAPIAWSLPGILAPPGTVGIVSGLMNFFNTLVSLVAVLVTGFTADSTRNFAEPFLVAAAVLIVGLVLYLPLLGRIKQLPGGAGQVNTTV